MRTIEEVLEGGGFYRRVHPEWRESLPWLLQGTTTAEDGFDLRLFGDQPSGRVLDRWELLRATLEVPRVAHARQVHGARVICHHDAASSGLQLIGSADGHVTRVPGTLLTVAVADCVPVSIVDPTTGTVALLHAGWRGLAAGIVNAGLDIVRAAAGSSSAELLVHTGPSICGECYEVGPEVHLALGLPDPGCRLPIDLAAIVADQAVSGGVADRAITRSAHCTRCEPQRFYSHRAGGSGRQVAYLGIRDIFVS